MLKSQWKRNEWARARGGRRSAFTLIELLLVLVILSVLAAIVVPKFTGRSEQARVSAARTQIAAFKTALGMFDNDNGHFPKTDEGLEALVRNPGNLPKWHLYLDEPTVPLDPWGNPYRYTCPGSHNTSGFDIFSCGPDGQEGTQDDIDNWSPNKG